MKTQKPTRRPLRAANDDVDAMPRPHARAEEDLRWYFERAEPGAAPSNYAPMILRMQFGRGALAQAGAIDETRLDTLARARRIAEGIAGAGEEAAEVLRLAFGAPRPRELKPYGVLANLVLTSPAAVAAHLGSGSPRPLAAWLGRLPRLAPSEPAAAALLDALNLEAGLALNQAVLAYRSALRRAPGAR